MKTPSDKQINFANEIALTLDLEFPKGDADFTAQAYWLFINENIKKYKIAKRKDDKAYLPWWVVDDNDIFFGQEIGAWEY